MFTVVLKRSSDPAVHSYSLKAMKVGSMLINCGRGGLVNTSALIDALERGGISGAAMDVYEDEVRVSKAPIPVFCLLMSVRICDFENQIYWKITDDVVAPPEMLISGSLCTAQLTCIVASLID
jgi:lactate dehydrogenase-like 2-hydroxyacid dehydrogenase